MSEDFIARFARQLAELCRKHKPSGLVVAFSGGIDSSVLLAACVRLAPSIPLRAMHVNHRLHDDADQWADHCAAEAVRLGIDYDGVTVHVPRARGHSLEAEAREQRYAAFAERLQPNEMLLTAHHAGDQLETVLLRLFRGAGVRGLCGILPSGELGAGFFGRPLLETPKAEIVAVANDWKLRWMEDPSNVDERFDRNFLRRRVVPQIEARWPSVARTVGRSAQHMRDAQALLEETAVAAAAGMRDPQRIPLATLRQLDPAQRRNVVRAALAAVGLPVPSTEQLRALLDLVAQARRDAEAFVHWPGAQAHLFRDHLHVLAELPAPSPRDAAARVTPAAPWSGPEGELALVAATSAEGTAALAEAFVGDGLEIRFRSGGERLRPAFGRHRRKLKTLLQEAGIVPWMRPRIPLLYRADTLVAVGDLWISDEARERGPGERAWRVRWTGHPALR